MPIRGQLQTLIILRLVLVSLISAVALSSSVFEDSTAQFLRLFLLVVYVLSGIFFLFLSYTDRPNELYGLQFFSDLLLVSLLIYSSGGTVSPFSPLYVLIIAYSSIIRQRRGAIMAVTLSIISYVTLAHLDYLRWIPGQASVTAYSLVVYRILWNIMGFVAVALLGSYLSDRLQKTRQELGAVRELHDNIVNSIRSGLITLDRNGRITSLNRAALDIIGKGDQDLLNQPLSCAFPPDVQSGILQARFESGNRPLRSECWLPHASDRLFLGMSCSPLMDNSQQHIGFILSCQDLTDIKKREDGLQLKEKMAAIGEVAAGVAHEIRNPLAALSGSIQILRSELELLPEQERLIEIALRECNRLNQTVADFLTYAGPPPPRFQPVNLVPLVLETVSLFRNGPEIEQHHTISLDSSDRELVCSADPDQLRQAIWNILQNAVRAMPGGGTVTVRLDGSNQEVVMTIADQGIGMTEEEQSRIFQPFHRGFKKGVGLGMAIVYQVVQQHHGRIEIESQPQRGTTVSVFIPASPEIASPMVDPARLRIGTQA